jgi:histidyl-tRNA synthetase
MAELLQAVKGMNDLLPADLAKWAHVEGRIRAAFEQHGYRELRTPVVEYTPLFVRSIGDATDIVEKEMYTFPDRDGKSLTLRPEGTASAVRAYLEHAVGKKEPITRWYYSGPMFRHERAQRGRYRQFYQMGIEALGAGEPTVEAEQIAMLYALFTDLGVERLDVVVNNVGGPDDRPAYRAALVAYFEPHRAELCPDCQRRLDRNPLRLLDCKVEGCRKLAAGAPAMSQFLSDATRAHFTGLRAALEAMGVRYRVDERLVRGLDYYTGSIFEVKTGAADLGNQNTLAAGGRYDRLVEEMGGQSTPAVGFAIGVERVVLSVPGAPETFEPRTDVFLVSHGEAAKLECLRLAAELRKAGYRTEIEHRAASMKAQLKRADRLKARAVLVIGEDELAKKEVVVRDMDAGEQKSVAVGELTGEVARVVARK